MADVRRRNRHGPTQEMRVELSEPPRLIVDGQQRIIALNAAGRRFYGDAEGRRLDEVLQEPAWVVDKNLAMAGRKTGPQPEVLQVGGHQAPAPEPVHEAVPDRLRGTFLANMSHELRTPLTSVLGFAKLLKTGRAGPLNDQQAHYVDRVLEGGEYLLHLVCDLLDLARIESGRLEFRPEQVDVVALVDETVAAVRPLADAESLEIDWTNGPSIDARMDPVRFKQVVYNYLSNAIKFTPQGGRIVVRLVTPEPGVVRMEVRDTGIGIPQDQLDRLFTEFTQLDNEMDSHRGAGLGLAITRRIVETMGGTVGVESALGRGSTFWAEFPRTL